MTRVPPPGPRFSAWAWGATSREARSRAARRHAVVVTAPLPVTPSLHSGQALSGLIPKCVAASIQRRVSVEIRRCFVYEFAMHR